MRISGLLLGGLLVAIPSHSFLIQTVESRFGNQVQQTWRHPDRISFALHAAGSDDLSPTLTHALIRESFQVWSDVSTARVDFVDQDTTRSVPRQRDGRNLIYFDETGRYLDAPPETGVIAITRIRSHFETGHITDADIIFNGRDFRFSAGLFVQPGNWINLKDVAVHEIGHLLGLEHTPLDGPPDIRPTMNPFNHSDDSGEAQSLEPDDIAGISFLYPAIGYQASVGSIAGQIRDFDQQPLFGTHIKAENLDTGGLFSTVSGAEPSAATVGHYRLHGLTPGRYRLSLAPIAGAISEENFGGVFTDFVTGFPAEFYDNARADTYARILDLSTAQHIDDIDFITDFAVPGYPFVVPIALVTNTPDTQGPYPVRVAVRDAASVWLLYQIDGGSVQHLQMQQQDSLFVSQIPGQHVGARIAYQIEARGADGKVSYFPHADAWLDFTVVELTGAPLAFTALRGDDAIGVVDTGTRRELARIPVGDEPIQMILAGDQLFVSNLSSNDLRIIDTATFQVQAHIETAIQPLDLALAPDGKTLYATNSGTNALTIVDVESGQARTVAVADAGEGLYGIAATADKIFTTDIAGSQVLVLSPQGRITGRIPVPPKPRSLALAPDGKTLYVTSMDTGRLTAIDADDATVVRTIDLDVSGTFAISPSPDGRKLYLTAHSEGSLLVVDVTSGTLRKKLAIGRNPRAIAFSPDGTQAYVTSSFSNEIHIVDAVRDSVVGHYATGQNPRGIALAQPVWPVAIAQPIHFALAPTFPNPFNSSTQITYTLAADILVELRVYNALGQTVRTLLHQYREAGTHQIHWDGKDDQGRALASGTYLLIMRAGPVRQGTKMLLLR
ncbi:MAG: SMP-30/gluconolactonase/LRE family protein [Gemmatimonadetes bacterium]|nr:SMP-30/gluconolactonase/LRE family protein [Gemmatimonadota bacterium]